MSTWPQSAFCDIDPPNGPSAAYPIQVEVSNPTATAVPSRPPDANDWYNHPVVVGFAGIAYSGIASCTSATYLGPDALGTTVSGSCTDNAGKTAGAGVTLHYDATPPTITAVTPSRPPDVNGWYNHPVTFSFAGTDAMSGIDSCTNLTYSGPGSGSASVTGSCRDKAGNVATFAVPLRYDATPPRLDVSAGTGDRLVTLQWQASAWPARLVSLKITRTPGTDGRSDTLVNHPGDGSYNDTHVRNGVRYRYTITARDRAGNVTVRTVTLVPGVRLLSPVGDAHLTVPPLLLWTPVRGADYYNVQLYHNGHKVLSSWPERATLQLRHSWSFSGHRYRLKPGLYRWYVWPGFGQRAAARYGALIGRGAFVIVVRG